MSTLLMSLNSIFTAQHFAKHTIVLQPRPFVRMADGSNCEMLKIKRNLLTLTQQAMSYSFSI